MSNLLMVEGYMLRTKENIEMGTEQLFAVYEDGSIKTCIKNYSSSFIVKGIKWEKVDALHEDAEFIGNYKMGV